MKMNKKTLKGIFKGILIAVLSVVMIVLGIFSVRYANEKRLIKKGEQLIILIEAFNDKNEYYPISLTELGVDERDVPIYYQRLDALPFVNNRNNYEIWFGLGLGSSYVYHSDTKKWERSY